MTLTYRNLFHLIIGGAVAWFFSHGLIQQFGTGWLVTLASLIGGCWIGHTLRLASRGRA